MDLMMKPELRVPVVLDGCGRLARYDEACRAIAAAKAVDEAKEIHDKHEAIRAYAHQAKNRELEIDAAEIRMRAERRLGELIKLQKESVGLNTGAMGIGTSAVPKENRTPTLAEAGIDKRLSSRAQRLAAVPEARFESMLGDWRARIQQENERVTVNLLREGEIAQARETYESRILDGCTLEDLDRLAESGYRAGVILTDVNWMFTTYSGKGKQRAADRYYDTDPLEHIIAEVAPRIAKLAARDCAQFAWVINPELPGGLRFIEATGFKYKTVGFFWLKLNKSGKGVFTGMGYSTRANVEQCWLAKRGAPNRLAKDVKAAILDEEEEDEPELIIAPRRGHSEKPDEIYERIERLYPGPYLELFARKQRPGWTQWGNEIRRSDFHQASTSPVTAAQIDLEEAIAAAPPADELPDLPACLRRTVKG